MTLIDSEIITTNTYLPDLDLYPVCRSLSKMSNPHSLRIMYLLHKVCWNTNLKDTPIIQIPIKALIDYLQIEEEEDPLSIIQAAIYHIMGHPIHIVRLKSGADPRVWNGNAWIINYVLSDTSGYIYLHLNSSAQRYFALLEALNRVRIDSLIRISRTIPTWLYITLTNASYHGQYWVIDIDSFSKMSMIEDREAWSDAKKGREMLRVLFGVFATPEVKKEFLRARIEKRNVNFIPWEIRNGNTWTIRSRSELQFNICVLKRGAAYAHYVFSFNPNDDAGIIQPTEYPFQPTIENEYREKIKIMNDIKLLTLNYMPI